MYEYITLQNLEDYFKPFSVRKERGIFFYRLSGYHDKINDFIIRYYEEARKNGVVIEGKIPNPDNNNLSYYEEMMGSEFQLSMGFLITSLKKWLPRMNELQREHVAMSIYDTLDAMRQVGKNMNMLKNAYIKFMCWLYYKFERIVNQLGNEKLPKILYEGNISNYELKLLVVLAHAGCDVVLLQYAGDEEYLKVDQKSKDSYLYEDPDMRGFPEGFSIRTIREAMLEQQKLERVYGTLPKKKNCTNAWLSGNEFEDVLKEPAQRGQDEDFFYNCFIRMIGVEDKLTYLNELYQLQLQLKSKKRNVVIVEKQIEQPAIEEINAIQRANYNSIEQMLLGLSNNIRYTPDVELERIMVKGFVDVFLEIKEESTINKLMNKAVYLLCWLKRYQGELFYNLKQSSGSCFIYLGGCNDENEALFLKFLSRLPVDILIFIPDLGKRCILRDKFLYDKNYRESMVVDKYPRETTEISMGTAAYHAERELDTIMYQDSGMYRHQQYDQAMTISLRTMFEEITLLWEQEMKYRPNFSVVGTTVNIPVICSKVAGIKENNVNEYWKMVRRFITTDTIVIKDAPYIKSTDMNPIKPYVTEFYKNNRLQKDKIKNHKAYPYGVLREETQEYILDKLEVLIEQKTIKGTLQNGTEYTIIATILNLNKEIVRLIQKFDFTKNNPKLVCISTSEQVYSLEDSIMIAFLNLIGFDIVFFIPTGYETIGKYYNKKLMEEHQIGEYVYDLSIPNLNENPLGNRQSWRDRIFKRG